MSRNTAVLDHMIEAGVMPALLRLLRSDDERVVRQVSDVIGGLFAPDLPRYQPRDRACHALCDVLYGHAR